MKLLTGNDLATGDVTWWTGSGWSRHVEDAADVGDLGEAVAKAEEGARRVNPFCLAPIFERIACVSEFDGYFAQTLCL